MIRAASCSALGCVAAAAILAFAAVRAEASPRADGPSEALQELAASVSVPEAAPGAAASARVVALLSHAAHALLTRAAVQEGNDGGGTITAMTALAIIPQARIMVERLERSGPDGAATAARIATSMEAVGLDGIRGLGAGASGWECDAALAALAEPLRPLAAWAATPPEPGAPSPWPGLGAASPLDAVAALVREREPSDSPWASLGGAVASWQAALATGSSQEVIQRDAQALLDLDRLQRQVRQGPLAGSEVAAACDHAFERWLAAVAARDSRPSALVALRAALPMLAQAADLLATSTGTSAAPGAGSPVAAARDALATALAAACSQERFDRGPWERVALSAAALQRALDEAAAASELDRALAWAAEHGPRGSASLRARASRFDGPTRAALAACCPLPGEDGDSPAQASPFWRAATEHRDRWLTALSKGDSRASALRAALEPYCEVAGWSASLDRARDARADALDRWGGWAPAPFGRMDDLPRWRGAVLVAMEDLGAGNEPAARKAMAIAREAQPDAELAHACCDALGECLDRLPPEAWGPLARLLIAPDANPLLGGDRQALERVSRLRLEEHWARRHGRAEQASRAREELRALAASIRGAAHE